jgi:hypothetical protein
MAVDSDGSPVCAVAAVFYWGGFAFLTVCELVEYTN